MLFSPVDDYSNALRLYADRQNRTFAIHNIRNEFPSNRYRAFAQHRADSRPEGRRTDTA